MKIGFIYYCLQPNKGETYANILEMYDMNFILTVNEGNRKVQKRGNKQSKSIGSED